MYLDIWITNCGNCICGIMISENLLLCHNYIISRSILPFYICHTDSETPRTVKLLKEGDSATGLALSDEIARQVAKDLKLYGGSATSFSPQLLSCAAVVWQYSKGGMFESLPDWTTVSNNDPRIKTHLHFNKMIHYGAPTGSRNMDPEPAPVQMDVQATVSTFQTLDSLEGHHMANIHSAATAKLLPSTPKPHHGISSTTFNTMGLQSPLMGAKALELLTPLPLSITTVMEHHIVTGGANALETIIVTGDTQMWAKTVWRQHIFKKRRAEDDVTDETDVIERPIPHPLSWQPPPKRKKKFMSDEGGHQAAGSIYQQASLSTASAVAQESTAMRTDTVSDEGFWDVDNRPTGWGHDSTIATEAEYSVRHHPKKCDKCVKLDIPCIVLLDKKYGFTRLACANCDEMKITCTINGVSVRERLQAKAKIHQMPMLALATGIPEVQVGSLALPTLQPLEPVFALATAQLSTCIRDTQVGTSAARNQPEPEPTARDILQSIHDLSRCFDLLAMNEWVDMLDARLDTVEERLDHRLNALEQWLSTSDEQWKMTSLSLGNLYMGLQKHKDNLAVHRPRENIS
ncbi:hypothetical protein BDR06DRAFT_968587 [Suillus hirtellus]|nr:hypothetical protein BDR06DRAFT_968587 [Suillus hirtellus]